MSLVSRLLDVYRSEGWTVVEVGRDAYHMTRASRVGSWTSDSGDVHEVELAGGAFGLLVSEPDLDRYVSAYALSAQNAFGREVPAPEAGFRLMLVHVDEQVATHSVGTTFRFDGSQIVATTSSGDTDATDRHDGEPE